MTLGVARAATSGELALFRTQEQRSILRAAFFSPATIYTARINQTFSTTDGVLEITYDTPSGTLSDVLPDMTMFVGSTPGAWDKGIVRERAIDASKVYISQTSDIDWANDLYLTIVNDFGLWARHVVISGSTVYMDGTVGYTDQHANPDPVPIMGGNRVLKLTGSTVSTTYDWSDSYMPDGSAIASYNTVAPGSSSSSGMTTATPTISWNSVGWKVVYLYLTGANGKTFFGVRYVLVWNATNEPPACVINDNGLDVDTGGWEFSLTIRDDCDLSTVHDHTLVLVFTEDYYGDTSQEIGALEGCENIVLTGWIGAEKINTHPEAGSVEFTAYTAQYFFQKIPAYPDGVEFVTGVPDVWTSMQNLTVDLGLWHFLHWRTTATRVMDVFLSGDTKYTKECSSLAQNLWDQIRDFAYAQIFARAGVNEYNQLFIQIDPQLIPEADRGSIPVVMTLQKQDHAADGFEFERITVPDVSILYGSGVAVDGSGDGTPYFSQAPGHTYPHYGMPEEISNLLVSSQAELDALTTLYRAARNNPLPDIPITLLGNNRLISCFPNQYCEITVDAADNPRGYSYSGKIVPTSKKYVQDAETGYYHTELTFEAEVFEGIVVTGDTPGGDADNNPPAVPAFPPLPDFPVLVPADTVEDVGTTTFLAWDAQAGFMYSTDVDTSNPHWLLMNGGLTVPQRQGVLQHFVTPNGACYCIGFDNVDATVGSFLARAPSLGSSWTILYNYTSGHALYPADSGFAISHMGFDRNLPETIGVVMGIPTYGLSANLWIGTGGTFTQLAAVTGSVNLNIEVGYAGGEWYAVGYSPFPSFPSVHFWRFGADGSAIVAEVAYSSDKSYTPAVKAGETEVVFVPDRLSNGIYRIENLFVDATLLADVDGVSGGTGMACDPTGTLLMGRWGAGAKGFSSDGGYSWGALPNLPPGTWNFVYAGNPDTEGGATTSRWFAIGATTIRETRDLGSSWADKTGDANSVAGGVAHLSTGFAVSPYGG